MSPAVPLAIVVSGLLGFSGPPARNVRPSRPSAPALIQPQASGISGTSSSPPTLSFNLTDPDAAPVNGTGSVLWTVSGGSTARTWSVGISSAGVSFTNCAEIPLSAVTVKCSSVSGGTGGGCNAATLTLTGSSQQLASGLERLGTGAYSVNATFSIQDAWKYKGHTATSCTLNVTYTITAN